jgi:hypothetical protein
LVKACGLGVILVLVAVLVFLDYVNFYLVYGFGLNFVDLLDLSLTASTLN